MLRPHRRIVEPGGYRPAIVNLPVLILEQQGFRPVQDALLAAQKCRPMLSPFEPFPRRLDPDQFDAFIPDEVRENSNRVRPAADTGDGGIG